MVVLPSSPSRHFLLLLLFCLHISLLYGKESSSSSFKALLKSSLFKSSSIQSLRQELFPVNNIPKRPIFGLISSSAYKAKDIVIEIPTASALTAKLLTPSSISISSEAKLAVELVLEKRKAKEESSLFEAYISLLPRAAADINTPYFWSDADLEALSYPPMRKSVLSQRSRWTAELEALQTSPLRKDLQTPITKEEFEWAMVCVTSRAFSGLLGAEESRSRLRLLTQSSIASFLLALITALATHNELFSGSLGTLGVGLILFSQFLSSSDSSSSTVLLPMIDSCNHSGKAPRASLSLEPVSNNFVVRALQDLQPGEEITLSYGNKHNDDLLQYFGFVEEDNPFDR